ncbi:T9SS type A sorting domain-containing protein [Taibaiella soli]|nr:T9SS type A sorting domain-containing protein [Taibaiella soli]
MTQVFTKLIAAAALVTAAFAANAQTASAPITGNASTLQVTPSSTTAYKVDSTILLDASTNYTGATVSINGFQSGDVLAYTSISGSGITGSYNSTTGVLTFTGSSSALNYQNILRSVTLTSGTTSGSKSVAFSIGSALTYSGNGHYYQFISGGNSWGTAKYRADTMRLYGLHGYLATITSQGENDFITNKLQADGWIGSSDDYKHINMATGATTYANQTASEGHWYWVTGPEKGTNFSNTNYGNSNNFYNYDNKAPIAANGMFINWNSSEPNNYKAGVWNGENSGEIYSSGATGKWNDLDSTNSLGFVVEYGGMAGDPSIALTFTRSIQYVAVAVNGSKPNSRYVTAGTARQTMDTTITVTGVGSIGTASVKINNLVAGDTLSTGTLPNGVTAAYNAATGALTFTGTATATQWQTIFRNITYSRSNASTTTRSITFALGTTGSYTLNEFFTANPLALTWVSFDGRAVNENAELTWATADEKNTATFDIEHSTDGASFERVATIAAKGTGNNTYDFTDINTANGANYYRLKQVDNDGSFQYSKVVKVNIGKETAAATVNFYPNPAKDVLNIATTGDVMVAIFNMNGVNVATQEVNGNGQITVSNLPEGMYICRVANANGVLQNSKIQIIK